MHFDVTIFWLCNILLKNLQVHLQKKPQQRCAFLLTIWKRGKPWIVHFWTLFSIINNLGFHNIRFVFQSSLITKMLSRILYYSPLRKNAILGEIFVCRQFQGSKPYSEISGSITVDFCPTFSYCSNFHMHWVILHRFGLFPSIFRRFYMTKFWTIFNSFVKLLYFSDNFMTFFYAFWTNFFLFFTFLSSKNCSKNEPNW